jgi:hypothetical protein
VQFQVACVRKFCKAEIPILERIRMHPLCWTIPILAVLGGQFFAEAAMTDEQKRRLTIIEIPKPAKTTPTSGEPLPSKPKRTRTMEELRPLALRVSQNPSLMGRFHSAFGSGNKKLASEVTDEITRFAQGIDPTVTVSEGAGIVVVLMKIAGLSEGERR